jgi:hypothetical protein
MVTVMGYSCTDFTDDIIEALGVNIPDEDNDNPSAQADQCLEEIGRLQSLEASRQLADDNGGTWGEHPKYTTTDWRLEVECRDTRSGYWDWVSAKLEAEAQP